MIGIGITTHNRNILDTCLRHFAKFTPAGVHLIVVDDNSDLRFQEIHRQSFFKHIAPRKDISSAIISGQTHLGIAKAKNECLRILSDCDDVFLFDDDTFPQRAGWTDIFINCAKTFDIHHLQLLSSKYYIFKPIKTISKDGRSLAYFDNCSGACLYFTRHALDTLGGFDPRLGLYGGEHHQMSGRAFYAKLTGEYRGASPAESDQYIYCVDMHYCTKPPKLQPPLCRISQYPGSSLTEEQKRAGWAIGGKYVEDFSSIKIPLGGN